MADLLYLQSDAINRVKIHPVVLFSILDHYIRRSEGQTRVIGTLLGSIDDGVVELKSCFPVPHLEKDEEVAVGKDFNKQMLSMHKRVNAQEDVVGWYATSLNGIDITEHSCLIHDFYGGEAASPIHLVVDTALTSNQLQVKAFISTPLTLADRALASQFQQIPVDFAFDEIESIAIDSMLKTRNGVWNVDTTTDVEHDYKKLESSMRRLLELIEKTSQYVDEVVTGRRPKDNDVGREIAYTVSAVPTIKPETFDRIFNNSMHDLLMITYLTSLTKAQLAITNKLNTSIS